jgi:hypothetical protein
MVAIRPVPLMAPLGIPIEAFSVYGAPGEVRTPDLWFRRPSLYPAELRARCVGNANCSNISITYRPEAPSTPRLPELNASVTLL